MEMGDRIKAKRIEKGMTQTDLAKPVGISRVAISQWEIGDTKGIRPTNLMACAKALGVTMEWLITGKEKVKYSSPHEPGYDLDSDAIRLGLKHMGRVKSDPRYNEANDGDFAIRIFKKGYAAYFDEETKGLSTTALLTLVK